jgi:hypothetical protein
MVKNMVRYLKVYFYCIFVLFILLFLFNNNTFGQEHPGDINNDDSIDLIDAVLTFPILSGQFTNDLNLDISAEINGDNKIGIQESIFILQSASGQRSEGQSSNAYLSDLSISSGPLLPAFNPDLPFFAAQIEYSVYEITLTPTAEDLNLGLNIINIVVTAQDSTIQTYTINALRQEIPSEVNAYLENLTITQGALNEPFNPDILNYTANVAEDIAQINITATTYSNTASLMINNVIVPSGSSSAPIDIDLGENNPISIIVISEDGSITRGYNISVTRGGSADLSTNAFLSGLALSDVPLKESFFPVLFNYSAIAANTLSSIRVTPETADPDATITINGSAVVSGQPSLPINLVEGENTISIEVTAQDPGVTQTYDIIVTREGTGPSSNANLSGLVLSETHLTTTFTPGILTYTANVLNYVEHITVSPTAANPSALITVNGSPVISGQASVPINLLMGDNLIVATVTAEDGTTIQTYTINVSRHGAPTGVAATVYVVDAPASSAFEFETLPAALEYLSTTLTTDQLGEIRIQTTQPMAVDELNFACNVIITLDPGASTTIVGPGTHALSINAGGSLDISGLNFVNTAGFVINSSVGLSATGSHFSGDTLINVGSGAASLSTRSTLAVRSTAGTGFVSKDLSFNEGLISGGLNVSAAGATQKDIEVTNTKATVMGVSGTFTESS